MPGLVPGIHVSVTIRAKDVDARDKPGHDDCENPSEPSPPTQQIEMTSFFETIISILTV